MKLIDITIKVNHILCFYDLSKEISFKLHEGLNNIKTYFT